MKRSLSPGIDISPPSLTIGGALLSLMQTLRLPINRTLQPSFINSRFLPNSPWDSPPTSPANGVFISVLKGFSPGPSRCLIEGQVPEEKFVTKAWKEKLDEIWQYKQRQVEDRATMDGASIFGVFFLGRPTK